MFLAVMVLIIGFFLLNPLLNTMNLEVKVHQIAHDYLMAISLGSFPLFLYNALRSFIDSPVGRRIQQQTVARVELAQFFQRRHGPRAVEPHPVLRRSYA